MEREDQDRPDLGDVAAAAVPRPGMRSGPLTLALTVPVGIGAVLGFATGSIGFGLGATVVAMVGPVLVLVWLWFNAWAAARRREPLVESHLPDPPSDRLL